MNYAFLNFDLNLNLFIPFKKIRLREVLVHQGKPGERLTDQEVRDEI